jgi:hypothetical protein
MQVFCVPQVARQVGFKGLVGGPQQPPATAFNAPSSRSRRVTFLIVSFIISFCFAFLILQFGLHKNEV